ncbi:MAG: CapA family protein [Gammaproteobacteria bacterium]|nr:CapA family protein [Gammaproteobacteria bacterium]
MANSLAALFAALLVAGCAAEPPRTDPVEQRAAAPAVEAPAEESRQENQAAVQRSLPSMPRRTFTVAAVGDMMLGTDYPENHLPDDDGVSFLAEVAPILRDADLTVGNLEGVMIDGGTPRKECKNPRACYLFRTPSRYSTYYVDAGFDILSLANNHARDFGEEGRTETMKNLDAAGILHSGREGDFATTVVAGLDVAFIAFAVTLNSNLLLDYDIAGETVRQFAQTHDIVLVSFHGGAEGRDMTRLPFAEETYYGEMRGDVVRFARAMVDAGADLVVGHGPHVVRAMERYKDRLIAYSLGNFATYYGISVEGIKGVAPILVVTLDEAGRFVEGKIHSTVQLRPAGPSIDPDNQALVLMRNLSVQDFATPGLEFRDDGRVLPAERHVRPHSVFSRGN